jgi:pimeloyl-ACP methyl ester carboxylesterase
MRNTLFALLALVAAGTVQAEAITLEHQGLKVRANLETSGDDWKAGPVILMTHGTLAHNHMEIMETLQQVFLDRGYSSLAINLSLGLDASEREGMYDCAVTHTHKHTDAVDEIGLWLDWLKKQGVEQVVLLGHSRGGNQTARFAAAHDSAAVKGVILVAPQTWSEAHETKDYQKRYGKPLAPVLAKAEKLVAEGKGDTLLKPVDFIYCEDTAATAEAFVSYYRPDPKMDTPTVIAEIEKPVLVFAGSADKVVANLSKKMAKLEGQKGVQFEVIDGAGHFFRDLYAEDLADIAQEFVDSL